MSEEGIAEMGQGGESKRGRARGVGQGGGARGGKGGVESILK